MNDTIIKPSAFCKFGIQLVNDKFVGALAKAMQISVVEAAGYVALLVDVGISKAEDNGELDVSIKRIEDACMWDGVSGELFKAFRWTGILIGDRDDDENPLRFNPHVWRDFAYDAIKQRIEARKRQANKRERDKAAKQAEFNTFMDTSQVSVTRDNNV